VSMFGGIRGVSWCVWRPDHGQSKEDGRTVVAHSAEDAAIKWAGQADAESADYLIVRGNDAHVLVARGYEGAPEFRITVSGESCPVYRARLAMNPNTQEGTT
jgi:hypothetical protein